jgi:hypothetical protein
LGSVPVQAALREKGVSNTNRENHLPIKHLGILGNIGLSADDKNIRKRFWDLV